MKRTYDIPTLDNYMRMLKEDAARLRKSVSAPWATTKADRYKKIAEILREIRQDQQMQGV